MDIEWITREHGREGELARLNQARNDPTKPSWLRRQADTSHAKIAKQLKDKKLMNLRDQLIKAARAGDLTAQAKIQQQMKAHTGEDRETGLYEQQ